MGSPASRYRRIQPSGSVIASRRAATRAGCTLLPALCRATTDSAIPASIVSKFLLRVQCLRLVQCLLCGTQVPSCERELCHRSLPYDQQFHLLPVLRDTQQTLQRVRCLFQPIPGVEDVKEGGKQKSC